MVLINFGECRRLRGLFSAVLKTDSCCVDHEGGFDPILKRSVEVKGPGILDETKMMMLATRSLMIMTIMTIIDANDSEDDDDDDDDVCIYSF